MKYMEGQRVRRGDVFRVGKQLYLILQDDLENDFEMLVRALPMQCGLYPADNVSVDFNGDTAVVFLHTVCRLPRRFLTAFQGRLNDEDTRRVIEKCPVDAANLDFTSGGRPRNGAARRGDVYFANLGEGVGCEQTGIRCVLVLQNDYGNIHSPTTVVAALTSKDKTKLPTHVKTRFNGMENTILLEQVRTISNDRLISYVGRLPQNTMNEVNKSLAVSLAMPCT
jgi:mRNA interferase MazF